MKNLEKYYQNKNYKEGIEFLKKNKSNFSEGLYYYNLGTFYAKDGELSLARFYFERAKDLKFENTSLSNNLLAVKQKLNLVEIERPEELEGKVIHSFDQYGTDWFLGFFLLLVFVSTFLYSKFRSMVWSLLLLLIAMTPLGIKKYFDAKYKKAVVTQSVSLFDGPSKIYEEIGELPQGMKVYLESNRNNSWYLIKYPEAYRGWVDYSKIHALENTSNVL